MTLATILLVEDNPITRHLVRSSLESHDFTVREAQDGRTALKLLATQPSDLVLQDLILPDVDGFSLAAQLRALPGVADVPILAMSGFLSKHEEARVSSVGFNDVITKPIEPSRLLQIVRAHLPIPAIAETAFGEGRRLLVVDDDSVQRKLLAFRLNRLGFEIAVAADGIEALESAHRSPPDAIVADVMMPRLDGFGLCVAVRKDAALSHIPLVLVTNSYIEDADRELAAAAGASQFVVRTPEMREVMDAVRASLCLVSNHRAAHPNPGEIEEAWARRVGSQLDRQVALNAGIAQRCTILSAELSILSGISDALARRQDTDAALIDVLAACLDAGGISLGGLYLISAEKPSLHKLGSWDAWSDHEIEKMFEELDPILFSGRTFRIPNDPGAPNATRLLARGGIVTAVLVPLFRGRDRAGALLMGSRSDALQNEDHIAFTHGVATQISQALTLTQAFASEKSTQTQLMVADRMASVGMLAAGVAHEINNPLSAVLGNLEIAIERLGGVERLDEPAAIRGLLEALHEAREGADKVRHIVRDLKLFSRAEEEKKTCVNVVRVLDSAVRLAWNEIRHRARVRQNYGDVPLVDANESRLGQVFLNLLVNAAQAIPDGHADENEIVVTTRLDLLGRVVVDIADTGDGIAPEVMKRLFTPFFTTKPVGLGTGLGLSICHRLITAIGGEISVESKVGKGTTFHVALPASSGATASSSPASASAVHEGTLRRGRVLVVDDDNSILNVVMRVIGLDHECHAFRSGAEALDKIREGERFDVILCDLMMPIMTGMDLFAQIAAIDREQAKRVVFLTGGAFTPKASAFLSEVPNHCLEKPFELSALRNVVNARLR